MAVAALGTAGFVGGRTLGGGAYVEVASASTYLIFTGMAGGAGLVLLASRRARRPLVLQLLGLALFLYGAIVVTYGFYRSASVAASIVLVGVMMLGALGWRDMQASGNEPLHLAAPAQQLRLSWSALWIPIAAVAAAYFALGDFSPTSAYVTRWLAGATVIVAVVGRTNRWAALTAAVAAGVEAGYVAVTSGRWAYVIAGSIVIGLSGIQVAKQLRRAPLFDPVQLIAVQLAVALLFRWAYYLGSGAGLDPNTYAPGTTATPFRAELPFMAMALAAIGLGVSRPLGPALRRLGAEVPTWWQVALALLVADAYLLLTAPVNLLTYRLTPDAYYAIGDILYRTNAGLPYWAVLAYALLAGICEETLFRGALMPRVGIVASALLFAAIHIQYGLTPILGLVFVAGIAYGLIRRHINLTTAVIAHAATDTGGVGLGHQWETTALWASVLVIALAIDLGRRWTRPAAAVKLPQNSP
ncbi:MAG TPA: type II CAAX endopeptidase family protein [Candidatus Dormibacteraeota bacterium]|nr:type II CAAX endopeptidase family protein [Candidatus Dormibacteraeota bacterium]